MMALGALLWAVGVGVAATSQSAALVFSGEEAFVWLERQVALGPRVPGTEANRQMRDLIIKTATAAGFKATSQCLTVTNPIAGEQVEICNVVVTIPGSGSGGVGRLWLGAHFDSRPVSDHDSDPERRGEPVPGANDGASGTAILLQLIETLQGVTPPTEVDLLFFDGEDMGTAGDVTGFCQGSRRMAETWRDFGSPLAGPAPRGLIVLDMVGQKGVRIPMEGYSVQYAPTWTQSVFERAGKLGLAGLSAAVGRPVYDDHVPFLAAGIPAVDLIDFEYPEWHTTADLPGACSAASLFQTGSLLLSLILEP